MNHDDDCDRSGNYLASGFANDFLGCTSDHTYAIVVADCCGSGMWITDVDADLTAESREAILFAATRNAHVCADCNDDGSTFSKVFWAGFAGAADADHNGQVTANELDQYLTRQYDPGRIDDQKHLYIVHGNDGSAVLCGNVTNPVQATSWGAIKSIYH